MVSGYWEHEGQHPWFGRPRLVSLSAVQHLLRPPEEFAARQRPGFPDGLRTGPTLHAEEVGLVS